MMTLDQNSSKTINFPIFSIDFFELFGPMKIRPTSYLSALGFLEILIFSSLKYPFDELNFFPSLKTNWLFLLVQTVFFSMFLS